MQAEAKMSAQNENTEMNSSFQDQVSETFLIKVVAGLNIGAEIVMSETDMILGSSEKADLILNDEAVSGIHARLIWDTEGLLLEPLGKEVFINGRQISKPKYVSLFDVFSIGNTSLCIGNKDTDWPEVVIPTLVWRNKNESGSFEKSFGASIMGFIRSSLPDRVANLALWRHFLTPYLLTFSGVVFLFLLYGLFPSTGTQSTQPAARISQAIQGLGWQENLKVRNIKGDLVVDGFLSTKKNKEALHIVLGALQVDWQDQVYIGTEVSDQVANVLNSMGFTNLETRKSGLFSGIVYLQGVVQNEGELKQVSFSIIEDIPGVIEVNTSGVVTFEHAALALETILEQRSFGDQLHVNIVSDELRIRGEVLPSEEKALSLAINQFKDSFGMYPGITTELGMKTERNLVVDVRSVSVSDVSWLITKDGRRYTMGSKIGAYTLDEIYPDRLVVSKDGKAVNIYL